MSLPPPISTLFPYTTLFRSFRPKPEKLRCTRELAEKDRCPRCPRNTRHWRARVGRPQRSVAARARQWRVLRSEEHTSELQSRGHLVCRLLLEKKNILKKQTC